MVQLSRHDSKKYQSVLHLKNDIAENLNDFPASSILEDRNDFNSKLDEFGETVVRKVQKPCKHITLKEMEAMVQARQNGETIKNLSKQFDCHRTTVNRILKKHGIFTSAKKVSLDFEKVVGMYNEMHTTKEIAKEFGVSPTTVANYLREHNIKVRSRWDYK